MLKGNKKRFEEDQEEAKTKADKAFVDTYKKFEKSETTTPFKYKELDENAYGNKKSKSIDELAYTAGSKVMRDSGIFDMESDLEKQKKKKIINWQYKCLGSVG